MLDFIKIATKSPKHGVVEVYPKFIIKTSKDLMIRGGDFYAVWNEDTNLWSTSEEIALGLIDRELDNYAKEHKSESEDFMKVLHMWDAENGMIDRWHKYVRNQLRDNYHNLDESVIFSNTETTRESYASKRLPYPLVESDISAYQALTSVLYSPDELRKIEWAIGAIVAGESKNIQKFIVMYGAPKTGKSTILNIIQDMFTGYWSAFDAKALGSSSNAFALEAFKSNPLVAIQHDGDLSHIEDNTRLNSLVSHEVMNVNLKHLSTYDMRFNSFLFMGTNKPVKISDSKSGIIRRLIDVSPTGEKISPRSEYNKLVNKIKFELGGIAKHCLDIYEEDPGYYDDYTPTQMIRASNHFYNFIMDSYGYFLNEPTVPLKIVWERYNKYCLDAKVAFPYSLQMFSEELKSYFKTCEEDEKGKVYYSGFISDKFKNKKQSRKKAEKEKLILDADVSESTFDRQCSECPAQYAVDDKPIMKWAEVNLTLNDISTDKVHFVKPPENMIVIDFDLKDENGNKSFDINAEEAAKWPPTYAETSKGGQGIHLHYFYDGDVTKLAYLYSEDIEIKVFTGGSSLRRKLTKCNNLPIATISSKLPLKEQKRMINFEGFNDDQHLLNSIKKIMRDKTGGGTKPAIDLIFNNLELAYESGIKYDLSSIQPAIMAFASMSSNHAPYCIKKVSDMKFKSEESSDVAFDYSSDELVFFDIEVFPNLLLVVYKPENGEPVVIYNPSAEDIEMMCRFKLVGFNCRRYDNHILYARMLGYSLEQCFELSKKIVGGISRNCFFGEAYNLSFTDVYDFSTKKQSLKKFEIELGIPHKECEFPWDQPVAEEHWEEVASYCINDVMATEAVFKDRAADWNARKILVAIVKNLGMDACENDTTNGLTTKIIFRGEKHPTLVYTDLATGEQH